MLKGQLFLPPPPPYATLPSPPALPCSSIPSPESLLEVDPSMASLALTAQLGLPTASVAPQSPAGAPMPEAAGID